MHILASMKKQTFFGTDGIRGDAATNPFLQPPFLHRFGRALASWAAQRHAAETTFYFGCDTRSSSVQIKAALSNGLGGATIIDTGLVPTPHLFAIIEQSTTPAYGIMITASHNKGSDNGIKLLTQNGKLTEEEQRSFADALSAVTDDDFPSELPLYDQALPAWTSFARNGASQEQQAFYDAYQQHLASFFPKNFLAGTTVALDCANGAATYVAPQVFAAFGAHVVTTGTAPDGHNSNERCGSTHSDHIAAFTINQGADVGFAFDGDADRVIAVNRKGDIQNGDALLALLATSSLCKDDAGIVGTEVTNYGLEQYLLEQQKALVRTPVGDKHVVRALRARGWRLGGEPSGHLIYLPYGPISDGIFIALLTLFIAIETGNDLLTSCQLLPATHRTVSVSTTPDLATEPFASIIEKHTQHHTTGRSVIRYSGTEPLLRIMVEDVSQHAADDRAEQLAFDLSTAFNQKAS